MPLSILLLSGCGEDSQSEALKDIMYEVNYFEYTPDTGNNSSRLRYSIKFTNPNDTDVQGFYQIKTNADGLIITKGSSNNSPCYMIAANSDCTYEFDEEDSHDLGRVNSIELVSVEYSIETK